MAAGFASMKLSSKVLWGEGLFLRPQHFQKQDLYHEARTVDMARSVAPYFWGVRRMRVEPDALQAGILRFTDLSVIFPDGEIYSAPDSDDLPDAINFDGEHMLGDKEIFHLAIAPLKAQGPNFSSEKGQNGISMRYFQSEEIAPDLFTNAVESEVTVLRKSVRILADRDAREQFVSMPLVRIQRTGTGSFEVDASFVAPATSLEAAPVLMALLRRLLDLLQAKVNALYGHHREPSKNVIEFRSGDIASFWLLHTASSAYAGLLHLLHQPQLHPERLFQQLLGLAGALMTFSKSFSLADLPSYSHGDPGPAFFKLDRMIRELMETVISTRYFAIALEESKPAFWSGRLDSEKIGPNTAFYLSVSADMPPAELVESIPSRVKVGAPDDVEKLVLSAMPGIRVTAAPQVPAAIPVRPGAYYFAMEARGPLYDRMLKAQSITIYVPTGFRDLRLELIAVAS